MSYVIHQGDVREVLKRLPDASFDACLTDPPYHLTQVSRRGSPRQNNPDTPFGRTQLGNRGFMGKTWDGGDIAFRAELWSEVMRVLKPGASVLCFGGTRTFHRLACAVEDAGFEIRDTLMWIYGQGFPKSLDISKSLDKLAGAKREVIGSKHAKGGDNLNVKARPNGHDDVAAKGCGAYGQGARQVDIEIPITAPATDAAKRWEGYGTALKPAYEPIIWAMKTCDETFAENALQHGVAGINIDGSRIETVEGLNGGAYAKDGTERHDGTENWRYKRDGGAGQFEQPAGRWPSNVILDEAAGALLDEQSGELTSGNNPAVRHSPKTTDVYGLGFGDQCLVHRGTDSGGASRFFYCAKAGPDEREDGNTHPTVKPVDLCAYLAKLLLPPQRDTQRRMFVPFCGSGSEMIGALRVGWDEVVGIEREPEYCAIAERRLTKPDQVNLL